MECVRNFLEGYPSQIPCGNLGVKLLAQRCVDRLASLHDGVKQSMPGCVDRLFALFRVVCHGFRVKPAQSGFGDGLALWRWCGSIGPPCPLLALREVFSPFPHTVLSSFFLVSVSMRARGSLVDHLD